MFVEIYIIVRDFFIAIVDIVLNRSWRQFENVIEISAPPDKVSMCLKSPCILSGLLGISCRIDPISGNHQSFKFSLSIHDDDFVSELRIVEQRGAEALLLERKRLLVDGDSIGETGELHAIAMEKTEIGTNLRIFSQFSFGSFWQRIIDPLMVRWIMRRFKQKCESQARPDLTLETSEAISGVASASVAFLGCWYFYDFTWALILFLILAVHEFGHVLAIRCLGMPVHGHYMVPFLGGTYLSKSRFRTLLDNAFCFLMGPAFSLLPTIVLYVIFIHTGNEIFGISSALCALVNLLNLIPVVPFDGGQVARSIIGSVRKQDAIVAGWACLVIGLVLSYLNKSYIFGAFVAFVVYQIWDLTEQEPSDEQPMSIFGLSIVAAGTLLIGSLYAMVLFQTMTDSRISEFLGLI